MWKPFFNRKDDPLVSRRWMAWRWLDIRSQEDQGQWTEKDPVYLRRLIVFKCPWFTIMVHRILRPDPDRHLHDHPWNFLAIVLDGWYIEERKGAISRVVRRFNFKRAPEAHRITFVSPRCTTLVITGPKKRGWGFHTEDGWVDWKTYIYG